jgi:putative transcriptional regulator
MHLPELAPAVSAPDVFFAGGPVSPDNVLGVGRMGDHLTLVDLEAVSTGETSPDGLRLFAGYSGWGPGQLESELLAGAWIVVDGYDGDVLGPHPRACGGRCYAARAAPPGGSRSTPTAPR